LLKCFAAEHLTVLLVEHDMDFVMNLVDRMVVMISAQSSAKGPRLNPQRCPRSGSLSGGGRLTALLSIEEC
jgi:branched-chain amino acid transport system permease protein